MFAESAAFFPVLASQMKVDFRQSNIDEDRCDFKNLLELLQQDSGEKNLSADVLSALLQLISFLYQNLRTTGEIAFNTESAERIVPVIFAEANRFNKDILPLLKNIVIQLEKSGKIDNLKILQLYRRLCDSMPQLKSLDLQDFKDRLEQFLQKSFTPEKFQVVTRERSVEVQSNGKSELCNATSSEGVLNLNRNILAETTAGSYESLPDGHRVKALEDKTEILNVSVQHAAISMSADDKAFTTERVGNGKIAEQKPEQFFRTEIFDKVVEKVQMALKGQVREMSIKLKPEFLGDIFIKIVDDKGKLTAELFVKNAYFRETLQANAHEIKNQIQQQGYAITEINVYEFSSQFDMSQKGQKFENGQWHNTYKKAGNGNIGGTGFGRDEGIDASGTAYYEVLGPSTINYVV